MIAWLPTASAVVLKVACPLPLRVAVPKVVEPLWKETVPVGVPEPGALELTVAVKVTDWPKTVKAPDEPMVVVVPSVVTVWVKTAEVLVKKFASPP